MAEIQTVEDILERLVIEDRNTSPRASVTLRAVQREMLRVVEDDAPDLIPMLDGDDGLNVLRAVLNRRPDLLVSKSPDQLLWFHVRDAVTPESKELPLSRPRR